ncbi:hypothetical protein POREN0001_0817 [Porphyromonas endodontalis ATCC 35406]|uniref:Uncharacterized protein n=2 Tax=Porphyromonas endodontalis TaxID=28124 RepID=C3J9R6_POREA|nr:hypothetical protein POREN0001_0817 [Porphyromonas endodontalis ATCC 35406]
MQDRCLFSRIGMLSECSKKISKGKVMTRNSMLGDYPYTLFQTLTRKGIWQGGAGLLSTAPRLVSEREKEPCDRVTRSLCRRAIKNINYGEKNLSARARKGGHIYQDAHLIYLPDANKSS